MADRGEAAGIEVRIGSSEQAYVSIRVIGRLHPAAQDYWDGNWLITPLEIAVGGFHARIGATLRTNELAAFRHALQEIHATLRGDAVLESIESWLCLQVSIDTRGSLRVEGRAVDQPGIGNSLSFRLGELDQSYLPPIIASLCRIEFEFPVLGKPEPHTRAAGCGRGSGNDRARET